MTAPAKPRRKGGKPIYSPEYAARRTAGKVTLRLTLEAREMLTALCGRWECGPSEAVTSLLKAEAIDLAQQQAAHRERQR